MNGNGKREKGENGIAGVTIKLLDKDFNEINVGADGILGTEDDSLSGVLTNEEGRYTFSRITHEFYRVQIVSE
ncbi:MAG: hypothetical protein ACI88H_003640 [Cocleimonas sp.]|jgi:hypothetical protein